MVKERDSGCTKKSKKSEDDRGRQSEMNEDAVDIKEQKSQMKTERLLNGL